MRVKCEGCGKRFEAKRSTAKWCSDACRKRGSRSGATSTPGGKAATAAGREFETATRSELVRLGKADSLEGKRLLLLASRMANPSETGSALAALSKVHAQLIDELRAKTPAADIVDAAREAADAAAREATS